MFRNMPCRSGNNDNRTLWSCILLYLAARFTTVSLITTMHTTLQTAHAIVNSKNLHCMYSLTVQYIKLLGEIQGKVQVGQNNS